ncbi:MAG: hypothetical protein JWR65_1751 [Massilia sp.]|jgi:hypothetical protein|nr:hypothetical protein [Massilia sp.]
MGYCMQGSQAGTGIRANHPGAGTLQQWLKVTAYFGGRANTVKVPPRLVYLARSL